ncbi:MAG: hypothetical protein WC878_04565 [Candidatus Paceibacterota bacterium]|jgi:hypothetical protein
MNAKDEIFAPSPSGHACRKSVATEITIPGTNLVFCVSEVSYENGKVNGKIIIETGECKKGDGTVPPKKEVVMLKIDVSHFFSGARQETEPIDFHSHE